MSAARSAPGSSRPPLGLLEPALPDPLRGAPRGSLPLCRGDRHARPAWARADWHCLRPAPRRASRPRSVMEKPRSPGTIASHAAGGAAAARAGGARSEAQGNLPPQVQQRRVSGSPSPQPQFPHRDKGDCCGACRLHPHTEKTGCPLHSTCVRSGEGCGAGGVTATLLSHVHP